MRRPQPATVVALIALVVALSGTSFAAIGGDLSPGSSGRSPLTCPARASKIAGLCFDARPSGPVAGVKLAADRCAAVGGFLPTAGQLKLARTVLQLGDGRHGHAEFTDSYYVQEANSMTTVLSATGERAVRDEDLRSGQVLAHYQYICVYYPSAG